MSRGLRCSVRGIALDTKLASGRKITGAEDSDLRVFLVVGRADVEAARDAGTRTR